MDDLPDLIEPVDQLHSNCIDAAGDINMMFDFAKQRARRWEPRPMPEGAGCRTTSS